MPIPFSDFYYLADLSAVFCPLGLLPFALGALVAALALVLRWTGRPLLALGAFLLWAALPLFSPLSGTEVEALHAFSLPVGLILARYMPPEVGPRRISRFMFPEAAPSVPAVLSHPLDLTNVRFMLTAPMVSAYLQSTPTLMVRFVITFLVVMVFKDRPRYFLHIPRKLSFFVYVVVDLFASLGPGVKYTLNYNHAHDYYTFAFKYKTLWQLAQSGTGGEAFYPLLRDQIGRELPRKGHPSAARLYDYSARGNQYYSERLVAIFGWDAGVREGCDWSPYPLYPLLVTLPPRHRRR